MTIKLFLQAIVSEFLSHSEYNSGHFVPHQAQLSKFVLYRRSSYRHIPITRWKTHLENPIYRSNASTQGRLFTVSITHLLFFLIPGRSRDITGGTPEGDELRAFIFICCVLRFVFLLLGMRVNYFLSPMQIEILYSQTMSDGIYSLQARIFLTCAFRFCRYTVILHHSNISLVADFCQNHYIAYVK